MHRPHDDIALENALEGASMPLSPAVRDLTATAVATGGVDPWRRDPVGSTGSPPVCHETTPVGAPRWQLPGSGAIREGAWGGRRARKQQCSSLRDQSRLVDHHDPDSRKQMGAREESNRWATERDRSTRCGLTR